MPKMPRYSKVVTSALYIFLFCVIIFTFWTFPNSGESVNPEVYSETIGTLLGLLGITGGLKVSENISDAIRAVAQYKYTADETCNADFEESDAGFDCSYGEE